MSYAGHKRLIELSTWLEQVSSSPHQSRYRLAFDVFEAALCCASLRATLRTKGRACLPSTVRNIGKAKQRREELVRRLENYLRQIQRRFKAELDNPARAAKLLAGFDRYKRTLVQELFRHYPLVPSRRRAQQLRLFRTLVTIAQEGLHEAGSEIPPDKELRKLVSQWLRDVRRFRAEVGMPQLFHDPSVGKQYLVTFVRARMRPTTSTRDPAVLASERHKILREVMIEVD
jgi:hypothetical protein